jgi:iron complex transport system ATP-binding protein
VTPVLQAQGLGFSVGLAHLVAEVDVEFSAGELVAIIGPNGAGKSTLLALLAGDLPASAGTVAVKHLPIGDIPPPDLSLLRALLGQGIPADIPFTAAAVVAFGRYPHRRDPANSSTRDRKIIAEAMQRTDTAHLADRTFATLSGGERTRVSLARVFAQDTPIVLLDEPTTALDPAHEEHVMSEARRLARQDGKTVITVLHDLNAAAAYADRIVLMADATVRSAGRPEEVLQEGLLTEVYGHPMKVVDHPYRGCPLVLTIDPASEDTP